MSIIAYMKDILNLKENRKYKLPILLLILIILFQQTVNSVAKKQINILTQRNKELRERVKEEESKKIYVEYPNKEDTSSENIKKDIEELKERYKEVGKKLNKTFDETVDENKVLVDETFNLNLSVNDIKRHIENVKNNIFNVIIEEELISTEIFYRIYVAG